VRRSDAWRRKSEVLRSFPGVGKVFCTTVLSKLPELGTLSGKAAAALVGIAPFPDDSGARRGRRVIRGGRYPVRRGVHQRPLRCESSTIRSPTFRLRPLCWLSSTGLAVKVAVNLRV
jgi:transposase